MKELALYPYLVIKGDRDLSLAKTKTANAIPNAPIYGATFNKLSLVSVPHFTQVFRPHPEAIKHCVVVNGEILTPMVFVWYENEVVLCPVSLVRTKAKKSIPIRKVDEGSLVFMANKKGQQIYLGEYSLHSGLSVTKVHAFKSTLTNEVFYLGKPLVTRVMKSKVPVPKRKLFELKSGETLTKGMTRKFTMKPLPSKEARGDKAIYTIAGLYNNSYAFREVKAITFTHLFSGVNVLVADRNSMDVLDQLTVSPARSLTPFHQKPNLYYELVATYH